MEKKEREEKKVYKKKMRSKEQGEEFFLLHQISNVQTTIISRKMALLESQMEIRIKPHNLLNCGGVCKLTGFNRNNHMTTEQCFHK
jgi:hypothetical protein